jgi:diguanylate cyclase (GGDEF)-like protein/putative nucleotidyltransferase with HDIG domain
MVFAFALYRSLSFEFTKWIVVALTAIGAAMICRFEPKITKRAVSFSAKNLFVFWAIVWIGAAGGIITGLAAAAAGYFRSDVDKKQRKFAALSDSVAIFLSAVVYLVAASPTADIQGGVSSQLPIDPAHTVTGIFFLVVAHYLLTGAFTYFYLRIETDREVSVVLPEIFGYPAVGYLTAGAATVLLDYLFLQFGIQFGLVVFPLAVIGTVLYRVHVRMLAIKTRQICEASRVHLATVEALATAIDARDQVGVGHVRRTQLYAIGLGELLGLPEKEIDALRTGALLHDIGKLAVPDHILNKPEKLTAAEMEKTKIHSSVGASILEKVGFDNPVVPTVRYHHENWDGSGYPEGLRGENIPLTGRILSIADAYDTMRCARPYRPPVSRDDARRQIVADAGKKFDPMLVKLFFDNIGTFETAINDLGLTYRSDAPEVMRLGDNFVEQIKLANREVFTLYELALEFSSSLNLEETLSLFTTKVREFVPFDTCVVYFCDDRSGSAVAVHAEGLHKALFLGSEIAAGQGATGQAIETRTAVKALNPAPEISSLQPEQEWGYRASLSLPLVAEDKLIGAVALYSTKLAAYGEEHLRLLETISKIASEAIDKAKQHAEAEHSALTDPMTGLPNARSLRQQFEKEAARAMRAGSTFQVLMLDLDGFKAVNDTFGHKAGDMMLAGIARTIGGQLRDYDFLARYAGDEFVAIIPNTTTADIFDLCRRIEAAVSEFSLKFGDREARVGVSIGSAGFPHAGDSFDQLLISADKKMYLKKSVHKRSGQVENSALATSAAETRSESAPVAKGLAESYPSGAVSIVEEMEVVELDETHIVSGAVN